MQTSSEIITAAYLLSRSEVVAIPTETVYGLAANAYDDVAVQKIFDVKKRPAYDPLILHTNSICRVEEFAHWSTPEAIALARAFWPGPLTLLLPRNHLVSNLVTSGNPDVAVRIPNHPLTLQLLSILDFPLAAPSANPFGYISPTCSHHVAAQLGDSISFILDGGMCDVGLESTIVGFPEGVPTIYRLGGLSVEAIESVIGKVVLKPHSCSNPAAPGMLQSHYAPRKPLYMARPLSGTFTPERTGFLAMNIFFEGIPYYNQVLLSPRFDLNEAAHNFFAGLRTLDALDIDIIYGEWAPEYGLGPAINDRLKRASVQLPCAAIYG